MYKTFNNLQEGYTLLTDKFSFSNIYSLFMLDFNMDSKSIDFDRNEKKLKIHHKVTNNRHIPITYI